MKTYTLEEIQAEMGELDKKLADFNTLMQRRADLNQLLNLTTRLRGANGASPAKQPTITPASTNGHKRTHADYAALVLEGGPKNIGEILIAVRQSGWQGSGDDNVDKKRIYVALYREKERFRKAANGKWSVIAQTSSV